MRKILASANASCPCDSGQPYGLCCGAWHAGYREGRTAPSPEALMRSRYSAYVLGLIDYLLSTWHPSSAPGDLELPAVKWMGLRVLNTVIEKDSGVVEFEARYKDNGRAGRLLEISRFIKEGGQWLYIDGQVQDDGH
jgi:SEC-C motif-containing protein